MKKILPINSDPYIRTYTHHSYLHSIICTSEKVLNDLDNEVAVVSVKDFSENSWEKEVSGLKYETSGDILKFYGNKWNINMNAAIFRECNVNDEIEINITNQLYSNAWASIFVFITNKSTLTMTDFDSSYKFASGVFSKDGLYYKVNDVANKIACNGKVLPVCIRLKKEDTKITLIYSNADLSERTVEINIEDLSNENLKIGIGVNLRSNCYYEWLFSNYVNFAVDYKQAMPIDYLCNNKKNWDFHTYNYFVEYNSENINSINLLGYSLIDYIKKMISIDRYCELLINDNIHLGIVDKDFFHQNLVYGYDDELECLYVLYAYNGKICETTISYTDFVSNRNELADREIYVYKYNPGYELYNLSIKHLLQNFVEYNNSCNISYYETRYDTKCFYGLDGIAALISDEGKGILLSDIRVSHMLYEHSVCNRDRVEYLFFKGVLEECDYHRLKDMAQKISDTTMVMRNLILKKKYGGKSKPETILDYAVEYYNLEKIFTVEMITVLTKYEQRESFNGMD